MQSQRDNPWILLCLSGVIDVARRFPIALFAHIKVEVLQYSKGAVLLENKDWTIW